MSIMSIAPVVIPAAAFGLAAVRTVRRRRARAAEIYRRAVARGAGRNPDDRFAAAREQAHAAGLPWVEADGTLSRPPHPTCSSGEAS